jgi:hypothetical protein
MHALVDRLLGQAVPFASWTRGKLEVVMPSRMYQTYPGPQAVIAGYRRFQVGGHQLVSRTT